MILKVIEAKQIGIIYHFTNSLFNVLGILKEGFKADKDTIEFLQNGTKTFNVNYDPYDNDLNSYSFTRDSKLEFIGNKQDIASKQEKDFAKWMKLEYQP